ncbi:hypothetical protein ABIB54_000221 [Frigoribacterium sp. UYMn621]
MLPIVLLAELLANGFDIEIRDNVLVYVGDYEQMPPTLLMDLDANWSDLSVFILERLGERS